MSTHVVKVLRVLHVCDFICKEVSAVILFEESCFILQQHIIIVATGKIALQSNWVYILFHSWSSGKILTLDDIVLLLTELLDVQTKWYHLGLQLKVRVDILDSIRERFSDPRDQLREMLNVWLITADNPTWKTLTDALRSQNVGASLLADILEAKYCLVEDMRESKH